MKSWGWEWKHARLLTPTLVHIRAHTGAVTHTCEHDCAPSFVWCLMCLFSQRSERFYAFHMFFRESEEIAVCLLPTAVHS